MLSYTKFGVFLCFIYVGPKISHIFPQSTLRTTSRSRMIDEIVFVINTQKKHKFAETQRKTKKNNKKQRNITEKFKGLQKNRSVAIIACI